MKRALPIILVVAILAVLAFGASLLGTQKTSADGPTQCKLVCMAGCERDLECGSPKLDCNEACDRQCRTAALRSFDEDECVKRVKALSCADAQRLSLGDSSMLSGSCGVP